jgi:predicted transcriptional regulator of viral defense system
VVAYHSALEGHGVAHSPSRTVTFTAPGRVGPFEARGYRFRQVPPPRGGGRAASLAEFVSPARAGDALVTVTSRERTLVDCLARLDLAGGLEELLRSAGGFTAVSAELVESYTRLLGSPTSTARAGWLVSLQADAWRPAPEPLHAMRRSLGRGTHWLERRRPGTEYAFVAEWRLYVPAGLPLREWLAG